MNSHCQIVIYKDVGYNSQCFLIGTKQPITELAAAQYLSRHSLY